MQTNENDSCVILPLITDEKMVKKQWTLWIGARWYGNYNRKKRMENELPHEKWIIFNWKRKELKNRKKKNIKKLNNINSKSIDSKRNIKKSWVIEIEKRQLTLIIENKIEIEEWRNRAIGRSNEANKNIAFEREGCK